MGLFQSLIGAMEAGEDHRQRRTQRTALDEAGQLYGLGKTDAAENALVAAGMPEVAANYSALGEARRARTTRRNIATAMQGAGQSATDQASAASNAAIAGGDPELALQFRHEASQLSAEDRQRRAADHEQAAQIALTILPTIPLEQRAERMVQETMRMTGANEEEVRRNIANLDLSDEGLQALGQSALSIGDIYAGRERRERYAVEDSRWGQEMGLRRAALDAQQASRMLSAEEAQRMGFRPGSVVAVDRRGMPHVLQDSLGFTDGEQNASAFANRMTGAEAALTQLEQDGVAPANIWARGGFSPEARRYRQAMGEWIAAQLRKDTGAAVTPQEFEMYGRIYFPVPGDTPEQMEQKRQSRARAFQGVIAASGGAYHSTFGGGAGAPLMNEALRDTPYAINTERRPGGVEGATSVGGEGPRSAPAVGAVVNGYRFRGGDPNNRSNWEELSQTQPGNYRGR